MENFKPCRLFDAGGILACRWFVFYYFKSPDTGKFIRFREWIPQKIKTASGRRDHAHVLIKRINKHLNEGFNPFAFLERKFTNILLAMDFIEGIKRATCRKRTNHTYSSFIKQFKNYLVEKKLARLAISDFNYNHAQDYLDYCKKEYSLNNRSYNNRITAMRTLFNLLIEREWILYNPFSKCKKLEQEQPPITAFSGDELALLELHLPSWNYDLYVIACLIFYCFLRPQEIVRLKILNIDITRRRITLPGTISKNKKHESVQIPDHLVPVLKNMNLNYDENVFVFSNGLKRGMKEIAPTRIAEKWRKFCQLTGIRKNIYSLKHTGVGMALESGINLRDLQLQLRHSSLEVTQIYLDKFKRLPSEKLSRDFPRIASSASKTMIYPSALPLEIYIQNLS